jgi:Zn-finger nucleic acid-binding protein
MARCTSCSAPLPANTNRCNYCNTRSDVDLHAKLPYKIEKLAAKRICPNCDKALQTIRLKMAEPLAIERCQTCYGLFFDKGEIELILQSSVSNVFDINFQHIDNINKDRYRKQQKIRYVKCPECRRLMNRVNFGQRSGVIIDQCIIHGIWLDNGELTHLLEWKKAGGQLLQQQHTADLEKQQQQNALSGMATDYSVKTNGAFGSAIEENLLETVAGLLDKLF